MILSWAANQVSNRLYKVGSAASSSFLSKAQLGHTTALHTVTTYTAGRTIRGRRLRRRLGRVVPVKRVYIARRSAARGAPASRARVRHRRSGHAAAAGDGHGRDGQTSLDNTSAAYSSGGGDGGTRALGGDKATSVGELVRRPERTRTQTKREFLPDESRNDGSGGKFHLVDG